VYGKRATPYEVLSEFSDRVGSSYADEDVLPRMARVVAEGVGASRAEVWLRLGSELRMVASWPSNAEGPAIPVHGGKLPEIQGADRSFAIQEGDQLLGTLSITKPPREPLTPGEEKLLTDLAGQGGLILRNVRLIEELRASRQRLVKAQDEERRRLERNIHDGAQQQLVALAVKMRLVESLARKDPAKAEAMAAQAKAETQEALANLRDLARGIYPPLLADQGLAAALEAQGRKSPVSVEVHPDGIGRYPQEAEAAVYFCVLEAMQNVAKYAEASRVVVRLWSEDGDLAFAVEDDGRGFDPASAPRGAGLQNMADRLDALGGFIDVASAPGRGTTITGRIPVGAVPG
jgi:signal transduction histidine kinase